MCDICGGSKKIRLPIRLSSYETKPISEFVSVNIKETYREYPCPECSESVSQDRLSIIYEYGMHRIMEGTTEYDNYLGYVKESVAHQMIDKLIKDGFIRFDINSIDITGGTCRIRATLGVVSPIVVTTMEERVKEVVELIIDDTQRRLKKSGYYFDVAMKAIKEAAQKLLT